MRIAVNLSAVKTEGTTVYTVGLLPALATSAPDDEFLVFLPPEVAELVRPDLPASWTVYVTPFTNQVWQRLVWEQTLLPVHLARWRTDVLFAPMEFTPLAARCPSVLAVHNPSPHLDDAAQNRVRRRLSASSCRVARLVVFPSDFAAGYLGDRLAVPRHRRVVVHHGTDHERWKPRPDAASRRRRLEVDATPYVLFVSNWYPYKGLDTLVRAFAAWTRRVPHAPQRLVVTGTTPDPAYRKYIVDLIAGENLGERVVLLGRVSHDDIPALYQGADVFVLPTSMETFGHPFVEAMASGVPLVTTDIDVSHEVCGDAARYFPPGQHERLADELEAVLGSAELRQSLTDRGRARAARYSWDREATETLQLLRRVGSNGGG